MRFIMMVIPKGFESAAQAIECAMRTPMSNNEVIEVRQIHEMPDFPEEVQKRGRRLRVPDVVA